MPLRERFVDKKRASSDSFDASWGHVAVLAGAGAVGGVLSGMFGVGGGTVLIPALAFTTDLSHQTILGTG